VWITRARSFLSVVLLGAAATLGSVGPAQAALYTGNWDPAYGTIFPSLGWEASAVFNVPDACLVNNGSFLIGACPGFSVVSAQVGFYDVSDSNTILESFSLNPNVPVSGFEIAGNQLTGVDTSFFASFVPTLSIAGAGAYSFSLILYNGDLAQLIYANPPGSSPFCAYVPFGNTSCGVSALAATGVFTPAIPEPETYVLMLAGLGALALARRRRSR
jgi:PEP-CTERM motif